MSCKDGSSSHSRSGLSFYWRAALLTRLFAATEVKALHPKLHRARSFALTAYAASYDTNREAGLRLIYSKAHVALTGTDNLCGGDGCRNHVP